MTRGEAVNWLINIMADIGKAEHSDLWHYEQALMEIREMLESQPERKTGRWLPDNRPGGGFWVCSCCKFPSEAFAADKLYKYCPVCGCRMEG
jgi:rubrerythrin